MVYQKENALWMKWAGKTESRVSVTAGQNWDGAEIFCLIRDSRGNTVKSEPAKIKVTGSVRIIRQQKDISVPSYQPALLSVKAQGSGLTYQWYFKKRGAVSWCRWAGHDSGDLTFSASPATDGMSVLSRITDLDGYAVSTDPTEIIRIDD